MQLVGNRGNGVYLGEVLRRADVDGLTRIVCAVAWSKDLTPLQDIAASRGIPFDLYTLVDGKEWPSARVMDAFLDGRRASWRLYLTRQHFHAKLFWLQGVGAYIGSGNLTDPGMYRNLELGIWYDEPELVENGLIDEFEPYLDVLRPQCREITAELATFLKRLHRTYGASAQKKDEEANDRLDREFPDLPGKDSPIQITRQGSDATRRSAFVDRFDRGLTLLRKLQHMAATLPRPTWVKPDVPLAVQVDQATEVYYTREVRRGDTPRDVRVEELHRQNTPQPDSAARRMLEAWSSFDGSLGIWDWATWSNDKPRRLRELLAREQLDQLDVDGLTEIIGACHAAREHARQVRNATLGLSPKATTSQDERFGLFAEYLLRQRTQHGRTVSEVLRFALWGDGAERNPAVRIWACSTEAEWKLPHLGTSILSELLGYARPDDYPPRNDRVVRTLYALGYSDV